MITMGNKSPHYWPAEWHRQDAVWFSWPHNPGTWSLEGSTISQIQQHFAKLTSIISHTQQVCINADEALHPAILDALTKSNSSLANITLFPHPTNDVWCRDHGATFVIDTAENKLRAIDWHFNAWGGKFPPWNLDDEIAQKMAEATGSLHTRSSLFLEGGGIEGNGAGVVITTEAVALNPNRNPDWSKSMVEQELKSCLGAERIFWLPSGIEGDDTDGHIDDLTRFVAEDVLITATEKDSRSPDYKTLARNKEMLQDLRTISNSSVQIIDLPMPEPLKIDDWRLEHLPASYANFLILNEIVIVPIFNQKKNDAQALGILSECFPDRKVIGFDSRDLVLEGGAVHCISQQQPSIDKR
jgi:agmatine deiminase